MLPQGNKHPVTLSQTECLKGIRQPICQYLNVPKSVFSDLVRQMVNQSNFCRIARMTITDIPGYIVLFGKFPLERGINVRIVIRNCNEPRQDLFLITIPGDRESVGGVANNASISTYCGDPGNARLVFEK
jgi:hypothetical protein